MEQLFNLLREAFSCSSFLKQDKEMMEDYIIYEEDEINYEDWD